MPERPSGTVTFLFTDIAGSTRLLQQLRDHYDEVLQTHARLIREAIERFDGHEIDTQGDAFFVAFARARDGVGAAVELQRAFASASWPEGVSVRVRMGLHTGEPLVGGERYVGMGVNRGARICAAGHGGQVLLSNTTRELVEDELPHDITVVDLGEHTLKDLPRPERIFQLEIADLPEKFPPLRTAEAPAFEGREGELARAADRAVWRRLRSRRALAAVAIGVAAAVGVAAALAFATPDKPPVTLLPNSLVRLDPKTLKPAQVIKIHPAADFVSNVAGYLWVDHGALHYGNSTGKGCRDRKTGTCDSASRFFERINPSTGDGDTVTTAPCGMTPDPSGDSVWVAECYAGQSRGDVIRVDAKTLNVLKRFKDVPHSLGIARSMVYADGWLWLSASAADTSNELTRLNPRTGEFKEFKTGNQGALAWSEGYGDLWMTALLGGSVSRMHRGSGKPHSIKGVAVNPLGIVVLGDEVWVGDWAKPHLAHFSAEAPDQPVTVKLPVKNRQAAVTFVVKGAGYVWATLPDDHALFRIDPRDPLHPRRIGLKYNPWGVAVGGDGIWVTLRGRGD